MGIPRVYQTIPQRVINALPQPTVYYDPVDLEGAGSGDGSATNPYTSPNLVESALTSGTILGIRTGREINLGVDITTDRSYIQRNGLDNMQFVPWIPAGAPTWPSVFGGYSLFGTLVSDWEEVDLHDDETPGTQISNAGVYDLSPGSGNWHLKDDFSARAWTPGGAMVGYGAIDSILDQVNEENYKSHGRESPHVLRNAWDDSGSTTVVPPSGRTYQTMDVDKQYYFTTQGGLVVKSTVNPATRWGGVYMMAHGQGTFKIADCDNFIWKYAAQGYASPQFLETTHSSDDIHTQSLEGLGGYLCGAVWERETTNLFSGIIGTGAGWGSVQLSDGDNSATFGDGTKPWFEVAVENMRIYAQLYKSNHRGWFRNGRINNVEATLCGLMNNSSVFFLGEGYAQPGEHELWTNIAIKKGSCGVGKFGLTDLGAFDIDGNCGGVHIDGFEIETCSMGISLSGGRRDVRLSNGTIKDCSMGVLISEPDDDGQTEVLLDSISITLDDWKNWATVYTSQEWSAGIYINRDIGFEPKGSTDDSNYPNFIKSLDFQYVDIHIGTADTADAYGILNDTSNDGGVGPWADNDDNATTGGDSISHQNGYAVALNQTQTRVEMDVNWTGPGQITGFDTGKETVDDTLASKAADAPTAPTATSAVTLRANTIQDTRDDLAFVDFPYIGTDKSALQTDLEMILEDGAFDPAIGVPANEQIASLIELMADRLDKT